MEERRHDQSTPASYARILGIAVTLAALILGFMAWADDTITLEGHWTVYTARCDGGHWDAHNHCTGQRLAAERHRFYSTPASTTVRFEVVGATGTTGVLAGCVVQDGRNWNCLSCGAGHCPVTRVMQRGEPKPEGPLAEQLRPVSKLTWHVLRLTRGACREGRVTFVIPDRRDFGGMFRGVPNLGGRNVGNARPQTTQAVVASLNQLGRSSDATTRWQYQ